MATKFKVTFQMVTEAAEAIGYTPNKWGIIETPMANFRDHGKNGGASYYDESEAKCGWKVVTEAVLADLLGSYTIVDKNGGEAYMNCSKAFATETTAKLNLSNITHLIPFF